MYAEGVTVNAVSQHYLYMCYIHMYICIHHIYVHMYIYIHVNTHILYLYLHIYAEGVAAKVLCQRYLCVCV